MHCHIAWYEDFTCMTERCPLTLCQARRRRPELGTHRATERDQLQRVRRGVGTHLLPLEHLVHLPEQCIRPQDRLGSSPPCAAQPSLNLAYHPSHGTFSDTNSAIRLTKTSLCPSPLYQKRSVVILLLDCAPSNRRRYCNVYSVSESGLTPSTPPLHAHFA